MQIVQDRHELRTFVFHIDEPLLNPFLLADNQVDEVAKIEFLADFRDLAVVASLFECSVPGIERDTWAAS
jgi:hypothetical protein